MKIRSITAIFMAVCFVVLGPAAAIASSADTGSVFYQGGVVEQRIPYRTAAPLELGYTLANSPYIILQTPTVWELVVGGGSAPYSCEAELYHLSDMSLDPFGTPWPRLAKVKVDANSSFIYTFTKSGRYFWQFKITDADGQALTFQTRLYESYTTADETNANTVVGKVNSIIADNITSSMSDYSRALVLHDWLITNANYDYSEDPYYDAEGVLLHGTGVCDSYARAYLMLMTAAGVDCMIVSGSANGGNHAWNMVKLGGSWYHVDCTWDDPGSGGFENHDYFCLDDATMSQDHTWNRPGNLTDSDGMLVPAANGGDYATVSGSTFDYDFTFSSVAEYEAALNAEISAGRLRQKTYGYYTGSGDFIADVYPALVDWIRNTLADDLYSKQLISSCSYGFNGKCFYISLGWNNPDDYIRIDSEALRISIGDTATLTPSEYAPASNAFTWTSSVPSVATVTSAYDETSGLTASIKAFASGKTIITATSADGLSDSVEVTVLPAHQPEFNLVLSETDNQLTLTWDLVPGATEYQVMLEHAGTTTLLDTVTTSSCTIDRTKLYHNTENQLYIKARRVVGGNETAVYTSEKQTIRFFGFDFVLPAGIKHIDEYAFAGNQAIQSLYIPDGAKTIANAAFSNCTSLASIRIPASIESIGSSAFSGSALKFVQTIQNSNADIWFAKNMPDVTIVYE